MTGAGWGMRVLRYGAACYLAPYFSTLMRSQTLHYLMPAPEDRGSPSGSLPAESCSAPGQIAAVPGICVNTEPGSSFSWHELHWKVSNYLMARVNGPTVTDHCPPHTLFITLYFFPPRRKVNPSRLTHIQEVFY